MYTIYFQYFKEAILFFKEIQWLFNEPMTNILISGSLESCPSNWLDILRQLSNYELNDVVGKTKTKARWSPSLIRFLKKCKRLNNLPATIIELPSITLPQAFLKKLSPKKKYEIIHLAQLVHEQCLSMKLSFIIDVGAGLGYICQLLNYLYGYRVLGLDANSHNIQEAQCRQKNIFPDSLNSVKYMHFEITNDSIATLILIIQEFGKNENFCLLGLHACGNLSLDMFEIFLKIKEVKLLIVISCCYHKVTLQHTQRTLNTKHQFFNYFPCSKVLKDAAKNVNINTERIFQTPFLRLACQETSDRWCTMIKQEHEQHSFYVLARATLELYRVKNGLHLKKLVQKGTRKSQCSSFETYLKDCTHRYLYQKKITHTEYLDNIPTYTAIPWNDDIFIEILNLWKINEDKQKVIILFTALQVILQQSVESLILFDRLCFLKENNCRANIIPVMKRTISPRSYAIVSRKKS